MHEFSILLVLNPGLREIFGVSAGFVLGFFAKLILLFLISAIISKMLHLERAYDKGKKFNDPKSFQNHK